VTPAGMELRSNCSALRHTAEESLPTYSRSMTNGVQPPQPALYTASWLSGWIVIVGSRCTGNRRPGARSPPGSADSRPTRARPPRGTDSAGRAGAAGGADADPPADSCTAGAASTSAPPASGAALTWYEPSGCRCAESPAPWSAGDRRNV